MGNDGEILHGQQYREDLDISVPFSEQMLDYTKGGTGMTTGAEGTAAMDQTPVDRAAAKKRLWGRAAFRTAALAQDPIKYVDFLDLSGQLPPVLESLAVTYNQVSGNGAASHPASQQLSVAVGTGTNSVSFNPRATAQSSASITPELIPVIKEYPTKNVPSVVLLFFAAPPVTLTSILTTLATANYINAPVLALPTFKPVALTFVLKGQQVSISQTADTQYSASISNSSYSRSYAYGSGYSREGGITTRTMNLPPTLHNALSITPASLSISANTDVEASARHIDGVYGGTSFTLPGITNNPMGLTGTVTGSVTPAAVPATFPASIPVTGNFLCRLSVGAGVMGLIPIRASVVDFTYFA